MNTQRPKQLYKYTTVETAEIILNSSTFLWKCPTEYNDPFDTQLDLNIGKHYNNDFWKDLLFRRLKDIDSMDRNNVRSIKDEDLKKLISKRFYSAQQEIHSVNMRWKKYLKHMRVFCLSEINDNVLMWAHYGHYHRGVVIELDLEKDSSLSNPYKIDYWPNFPLMGLTEMDWLEYIFEGTFNFDEHFFQYALIKSNHWSYEKEWRCIDLNEDSDNLTTQRRVSPKAIKSIYLGCECLKNNVLELLNILRTRYKHVDIFQALKKEDAFELEFRKI